MLYMVTGRSAPKRAHKFPKYIHDTRNLKVGLMGGSFNPPHEGHFTIAKLALKLFGLDEIWWLLTPRNPLKDPIELKSINDRSKQTKKIAHTHNSICCFDKCLKYNKTNKLWF